VEGDVEAMALYAGEGVGLVRSVQSAAAIFEEFAGAIAVAREKTYAGGER
jgi:hypothetical protein